MKDYSFLLEAIKKSILCATGCTEPVAIALNCAVARSHTPGSIQKVEISIDMGLLKNALHVGIPGVSGRGIELCAALGIVGGNAGDGMNVLGKINKEHEKEAEKLLPLIHVSPKENCKELFIETILSTNQGCTRVITYKNHDNVARIEHPPFAEFIEETNPMDEYIKQFSLDELKDFADDVELEKIRYLEEGITVNRRIAERGMEMGFGQSLLRLNKNTLWGDTLIPHVQMLTGAASFARMTGVQMPVMIATGSGNQGITIFLTIAAAADKLQPPREQLIRGLALALSVNLFAKAYLGTLAPICACGVASGLAASVGLVYIMDGTVSQMTGAIRNMIGGITGMICDGAKEGCANKVALSASCAALSAMTAASNFYISEKDGILAEDIHEIFSNMEYLTKKGMDHANRAILTIMKKETAKF
jgi:L-cysteine desulfidase